MKKTHWRKCDKTDFFGSVDLEELLSEGQTDLILTIKNVEIKECKVGGTKGNFRVATFAENVKPMILNVTNAKVIKSFCKNSPHVEDWINIKVSVYIQQNVRMGAEMTEALRFRNKPVVLPMLNIDSKEFQNVLKGIANGYTIEQVKSKYRLSKEVETKLMEV